MFNTISWQSYWTAMALTTAFYYLAIYLLYVRNSSLEAFGQGPNKEGSVFSLSEKSQTQPSLFDDSYNKDASYTQDNREHIAEFCMDELKAYFENQKKTKAVKSEVVYALYNILQKYPALRSSEYKESLTKIIATECENICSIHLNAEELKGVWFG
jgi:hypothetical protein